MVPKYYLKNSLSVTQKNNSIKHDVINGRPLTDLQRWRRGWRRCHRRRWWRWRSRPELSYIFYRKWTKKLDHFIAKIDSITQYFCLYHYVQTVYLIWVRKLNQWCVKKDAKRGLASSLLEQIKSSCYTENKAFEPSLIYNNFIDSKNMSNTSTFWNSLDNLRPCSRCCRRASGRSTCRRSWRWRSGRRPSCPRCSGWLQS